MKRLTYEFVKESFEKEGYTLLSGEYKNSRTKLNYKCPKGHEYSIVWSNWYQRQRCPSCAGNIKLTLEQVRKSFENEGCTLLSKEYKDAHTMLDYKCSKGHKHSIVWGAWQQGQRCPVCAGVAKPTLEQVKKSFEQEGYVLLSEEYVNSITKLEYICSMGHNHSVRWNDWRRGCRCPVCDNINNSINKIGAGNPNWQGGISYEPYCPIWSDKEYKQYIRSRDGNKCLNPCCNKNYSKIHIHHIDYNKKNCSPGNLITICDSCNSKANFDRDWHQTWYQAIIKNRYGGMK